MKNNLILSKYKVEKIQGTNAVFDNRTFFGSKMVDIENTIIVDNSVIQYSEVLDINDKRNSGFQYYKDINEVEKNYLIILDLLKSDNQTMTLLSQNAIDLTINTNWLLIVDWKTILTEYLFYKLKEARTFKKITYHDIKKENVNLYVHEYINENLINRYDFSTIDLYVEYFELDQHDKDEDVKLAYNPTFDVSVRKVENKINNVNSVKIGNLLNINYKQTKSSKTMMFKYYFDLNIIRI